MEKIVEVENLKKYFFRTGGLFKTKICCRAVDDVSFYVEKKEILGLVGESGCGKTTCGKLILRIIDPTDGNICFNNRDITNLKQKEMKILRKKMMIIYQDPFGSLDPRMAIGKTISEPMIVHQILPKEEIDNKTIELMEKVGLTQNQMNRYPHEFSGGQRQRIGIARALATNPEFIVADEPVSALDVSIQAQIINLLEDLKKDFGLTLLFITHDLSVIKHICSRVIVMYLGKIVEIAPKKALFDNPKHPYTEALLSVIPVPNPKFKRKKEIIMGDIPSPMNPPEGCRFHPRCPQCFSKCSHVEPKLKELKKGHFVACHLY